jgi:hypothetical protein
MITHSWASGVARSFIPIGLKRTTSRPTSTLRPLRPTAPANECTAFVLRTECDPMNAIFRAAGIQRNLSRWPGRAAMTRQLRTRPTGADSFTLRPQVARMIRA